MKDRNTINEDFLAELEDHYNGYGNFEKIPKGEKNPHQDSKRIPKSERKVEKSKRKTSRWDQLETLGF